MRIYLIRHGRQNSPLCNVNVSLDSIGRKQARLVGKRLANYGIDAIYASDLLRAQETAEIIREELFKEPAAKESLKDTKIHIREEIREIDFGDLEGRSDEEIHTLYKEFMQERNLLEKDLAFPNGECGADVVRRVHHILNELENSEYKNIVMVTHGGVIRSLIAHLLHMSQNNKLLVAKSLENTSITELLYVEKNDRYYVERINDYAHLEGERQLLRCNWKR